MKSVVYGAGAVGSVLGARLFNADKNVVLVARPNHTAAINQKGLKITGIEDYTIPIPASADPSIVNEADLIFLTVKAQDTELAVEEFAPFLRDSAVVISLQNGVRNPDLIARIVGEDRTIPGIVRLSATYLNPGEVIYTHDGICIIGERTGMITERLKWICDYMTSGVPTRMSTIIEAELWGKLVMNLLNVPFALTGLPFPKGFEDKYLRLITIAAMNEGMNTVEAAGIRAEYHNLIPFLKILENEARITDWLSNEPSTKFQRYVSTHQSVIKGKEGESSFLTGEIVHLGEKIGIKTPINSYLIYLIQEQTKRASLKYLSSQEIWQALKHL